MTKYVVLLLFILGQSLSANFEKAFTHLHKYGLVVSHLELESSNEGYLFYISKTGYQNRCDVGVLYDEKLGEIVSPTDVEWEFSYSYTDVSFDLTNRLIFLCPV